VKLTPFAFPNLIETDSKLNNNIYWKDHCQSFSCHF
jgi:hypothetical protein